MFIRTAGLRAAIVAALVGLASPARATLELIPVISSGISNPIFIGHAGDGSHRLFIEEQIGIIRVLQPGSSTPTVFLDIHAKVLPGGERGLLGLAFHPLYAVNGRFFVYYTRPGDGAIVLAEYKVSAFDRDVADPTEKVLLTIPHPNHANHNGGMIAFGPDGYLYLGIGDGGSGNDPPNNAQNVNVLLGKILRIDINPSGSSGLPYVSPPTNPFSGATPGRDEIFALGLRNPWRFSFDRITGQQWVGDVGQGSREEIDTPIVGGGNYGWRVYEGSVCTNNDPGLCNPANYTPPLFEYDHSNGRCSVTGGYVYRGSAGTLPSGTYVYADFCSGEIFGWDGSSQQILLETNLNISSFGEDEQGELYVVHRGGSVSRIASTSQCPYALTPSTQNFGAGGGTGNIGVATRSGCGVTAVANAAWFHVSPEIRGFENAVTAHHNVVYSVDVNTAPDARTGTLTIAGLTFTVEQSGAAPTRAPVRSGTRPSGTRRPRPR